MKPHQDAYGREVADLLQGLPVFEIVERDDGYIDAHPANGYLAPYEAWPESEREAMTHVQGRVLDIGCGAGRHSLYLQAKGFDVSGIDISPGAIDVCQRRGLRNAHILSITQVRASLGEFDTVLMMGHNFGLFANERRARHLLQRFHRLTSPHARIIAQVRDPYDTDNPLHIEYHQRNRSRGRMGGQLRIRVRYQKYVTPWFDYLFVSPDEMRGLLEGTGWHITNFLGLDEISYIAIIKKD
jgi:SAM-dependent methyltransferase